MYSGVVLRNDCFCDLKHQRCTFCAEISRADLATYQHICFILPSPQGLINLFFCFVLKMCEVFSHLNRFFYKAFSNKYP